MLTLTPNPYQLRDELRRLPLVRVGEAERQRAEGPHGAEVDARQRTETRDDEVNLT